MLRLRTISLVFLALAACSSDDPTDANGDGIADGVLDPNNVTVVAGTMPQGFVAGEVWDATANRPLDAANIRLFGGGLTVDPVQTPASGEFGFGPIPAGATFSVKMEKADYTSAVFSNVTIDDAAGNFPTVNGAVFIGPIGLLPTNGSYSVQVISADGAPVEGAAVTVETSLAYVVDGRVGGSAHAGATTDVDGRATVEGLPNVRALPPRFENAAGVVVHIAPVDLDGDGVADLDGKSIMVPGTEVRNNARPRLVVLEESGGNAFVVVASNVAGFTGTPANASVLADGEPIRIVFSGPIDRESLIIDLQNEDGSTAIVTSFLVGALGNTLTITAADPLAAGLEYNLAVRVHSADTTPVVVFDAAAPFFVAESRADPIQVLGTFHDGNADGLWGSGADDLRLVVSNPLGRAGVTPAFVVELWVALDLNGTSTVGDAAGELPAPGGTLPAPILLDAAEPNPGNGAGASGFTRFLAPRRINLPIPIGQNAGAVDFEVHFTPARNGGAFVTTPGGRQAPERVTGTSALTSG